MVFPWYCLPAGSWPVDPGNGSRGVDSQLAAPGDAGALQHTGLHGLPAPVLVKPDGDPVLSNTKGHLTCSDCCALVEVAAEIATEQKIDIIFLKATVVLVNRELDITEDALKRLDENLPSVAESATQN